LVRYKVNKDIVHPIKTVYNIKKPKELIEKWVEIFNQGNAEKITELFHLDAINY